MRATGPSPTRWNHRDDAELYLLLERARWLCDGLAHAADRPRHIDGALAVVDRELGLAAYIACAQLDPGRRRQLRHDGCAELAGRRLPAASILEDLCSLIRSASALAHGTRDPEVCEELHLAAEYVDDALRKLTARRLPWRRRMAWRRPRHDAASEESAQRSTAGHSRGLRVTGPSDRSQRPIR